MGDSGSLGARVRLRIEPDLFSMELGQDVYAGH